MFDFAANTLSPRSGKGAGRLRPVSEPASAVVEFKSNKGSQKREIRNYCQSAMVSDFFCFSVICHNVPRFVASSKITAEYPFVAVMPKNETKGYLL